MRIPAEKPFATTFAAADYNTFMHIQDRHNTEGFWVVGINYKKTDASVRGMFAINTDQYDLLLAAAPDQGLNELFVVSTCNRTEIYGLASSPDQFIELLCAYTAGDAITFSKLAYTKNGAQAIAHLYQVAAGLDSQILGDYEILGQIKNAVKQAKGHGMIGPFTERLLNSALQSSKAIKTHTELSGGTVSVSFAAVQYIKEHIQGVKDKNIMLLGTGKIGRATCRNLVDYLHTTNITLVNRTEETAQKLAGELQLNSAPVEDLAAAINAADIILVSTNANEPVILKSHLENAGAKMVIDMSIPCNVAADAQTLPNVHFVDVDVLSKIKDETLQKRKDEIPKALCIINEHIAEFNEWLQLRKYVPLLKEVKNKLKTIHIDPFILNSTCMNSAATVCPDEKIQKVINSLAIKMRSNNTVGCHYIEAINDYIG